MNVEILFFAAARDAAGQPRTTLDLPVGTTAAEVLVLLVQQRPALAALAPRLRYAVNEDFVEPRHVLRDGDQMALIPPVSGG